MDDLADALAGSFQVSNHPNNPAAPHPRFASYKVKPAGPADQYVRRQKILERQKEKRLDYMNLARGLTEGDWIEGDEDDEEEEEDEQMDVEVLIRRPGRYYKNQLMLSEWMIDRPADLEENWLMLPCPVGRRSLIVAARGITSVYSKSGIKVNQFQSLLPGGNSSSRHHHSILDGIYVETEQTYYILDLMSWANHPIYESETEFRFFWTTCKFSENPGLSEIGPQNKFKFIQIPNCQCTKDNITGVMATTMNTPLDGLLFYHRAAHYLFGPTPLVLWLKAYMLPEILRVTVPQHYLDQKPHEYVCFAHHVDKVTAEKARQEKKRNSVKRGQPSPGRRGSRGRVPTAVPQDRHLDNNSMDLTFTSSPGDITTSPSYSGYRGAPSGKGRGRGRGRGRGHGRGQYQIQNEELSIDDLDQQEQEMDVSTSRRGRRRNRHRKGRSEGMDTLDGSEGLDTSNRSQADSLDTR